MVAGAEGEGARKLAINRPWEKRGCKERASAHQIFFSQAGPLRGEKRKSERKMKLGTPFFLLSSFEVLRERRESRGLWTRPNTHQQQLFFLFSLFLFRRRQSWRCGSVVSVPLVPFPFFHGTPHRPAQKSHFFLFRLFLVFFWICTAPPFCGALARCHSRALSKRGQQRTRRARPRRFNHGREERLARKRGPIGGQRRAKKFSVGGTPRRRSATRSTRHMEAFLSFPPSFFSLKRGFFIHAKKERKGSSHRVWRVCAGERDRAVHRARRRFRHVPLVSISLRVAHFSDPL